MQLPGFTWTYTPSLPFLPGDIAIRNNSDPKLGGPGTITDVALLPASAITPEQVDAITSFGNVGIRLADGYIAPLLPVDIDIKPGSTDNPINPKSKGKIPVALLSSATFNAPALVAWRTLTFGRTGRELPVNSCHNEDVNNDGHVDLVCTFTNSSDAFLAGDDTGMLRGMTLSGQGIVGRDSVRIVPKQ